MILKKLRYYIRLTYAFLSRFKGVLTIGALFGISIFFFANYFIPKISSINKQKIGIAGRYLPDELPIEILSMISDGLTTFNENAEVEPKLASNWSTPDKGKSWIFTLEDTLTWQDDTKVIAQDLTFKLDDVEIESPDEKTVIFTLIDQYAPFPGVVSKPVFKQGLLGTGEWSVDKIRLVTNFVQEISLKNSKGDEILYKIYPTEDRLKLALKMGQVDEIHDVYDPKPFDTWQNTLEVKDEVQNGRMVTIFFNTKDRYLSEKSLRQALAYSIDKDTFDGPRATSPIKPYSWAFNTQIKHYDYDAERARELLNEMEDDQKEGMTIKLVSTPVLLPVAEGIVEQWKAVGVDAQVLVSSTIPTDYQAYLAIFDPPEDPDQYSIWHSTQEATNISKYSNPRIDKILEDGRVELDIEERKKIYFDFQRFLLEDLPAVFLYHPKTYQIIRK
jgi:peptide/nickel transport system substrate-binding protein